MSNTDLNAQLSTPALNFLPGYEIYRGKFENGRKLVSYNSTTNVGIIELHVTGLRFAFTVKREAKPLAVRNFVSEYELELHEIDTVATPDGIEAAMGAKVAGKWLVRAEAIEPTIS